ncbi:MAG: MarR family transcriptional regulator [Pirellulaceae bacterium]
MLPLEDQIVVAIRKVIRAVDLHSRHLVHAHGLTGPQLAVLREVARHGEITPSELAKRVHLSLPTLTGIIKRLQQRCYLARTPNANDKRSVTVKATPEGEQALQAAPSLLHDQFRKGLSELKDWEQLQILATLQRVAELMHAKDLAAAPLLTSDELAPAPLLDATFGTPPASNDCPENC